MKAKPLVTASLMLNLVLAATVMWLTRSKSAGSADAQPASAPPTATKAESATPEAAAPLVAPTQSFDWRMVESEDYKKYIANLRGIECPEPTIRAIIIADVDKLYAPRMASLRTAIQAIRYSPTQTNKWWLRRTGGQQGDKKSEEKAVQLTAQVMALVEEMNAMIKELLGIDWKQEREKHDGWTEERDRELSFLPEEKREPARKAGEAFEAERQKIYREVDPRDQEAVAKAETAVKKARQKMLAEMGRFLSPQEIQEYELRTSSLAYNLRMELRIFKPTEEEFRALFNVKRELEDGASPEGGQTPDADSLAKQRAAGQAADAKLKELLGADRYAEYQRRNDAGYCQLVELGELLGFDRAAAAKVCDMQTLVQGQVRRIQSDPNVTPAARDEALKAIRSETEKSIVELIGPRGFKAYKQQTGHWLDRIAARPPLTPSTP